MKKDSFPFNLKWCNALLSQPNEVRLEVYDAIMNYALSGETVELSPIASMAFSFIKDDMDKDRTNIEDLGEKRRNAALTRWQRKKAEPNKTTDANAYFAMQNDAKNANDANAYFAYTCINQEKERTKEKEDIYNNINNNISLQTNNNKEKKANKKKKVFTQSEQQFEDFRLHYPGIKRGFQIEFDNFKKKHPNWQDILPLLIPAVDRLIAYREQCRARGQFAAEYPHLQTWLNQSRWEIEYPDVTQQQTTTHYGTSADIEYERRQAEFRDYITQKLATPEVEPDISEFY